MSKVITLLLAHPVRSSVILGTVPHSFPTPVRNLVDALFAEPELWGVLSASGCDFPLKRPAGSHGANHPELELQ